MNKKARNAALLAAAVLLSIAGLFILSWIVSSEREPASPAAAVVPAEEKKEAVKSDPAPARPVRRAAPKTNDDIRRLYGRVETVYLVDGRSYTGAVVATDGQEYSIVTVGGMKKVPMSQVKMRDIIR